MSGSEDNVYRLRVTHDGGTPVGELAYSKSGRPVVVPL